MADQPSLTFKCRVKILIREYLFAIIASTVGLFIAVRKFQTWKYSKSIGAASRDLYQSLFTDLTAMGHGVNGISDREIFNKYLALPGNTGVKRDEATFSKSILPGLEQMRRDDRKITTIERMQLGRPTSVWQLK